MFVGDIVPELTEKQTLDIFELIKYGFNVLNNHHTYEVDKNSIDD